MSPDTWQTLGTVAALLLVGGYNGWRTHRAEQAAARANRHAATAATQATTAAAQTVATGNGFAGDVRSSLRRIEHRVEHINEQLTEHLAAHAASDLTRPTPPPRQGDSA